MANNAHKSTMKCDGINRGQRKRDEDRNIILFININIRESIV